MTSKKLLLALLLAFTVPVFAQEADLFLIPYRKGDLWGYASPDKTIIITPQYSEADFFYEGLAAVKKGDRYGYINKAGKVVIPFKFYTAKAFRFGYFDVSGNTKPGDGSINPEKTVLFAGASLTADGYEICIDTKGQKLKCPAINESSATDLNKQITETIVSNYSTIQKSELFDKIVADYKMPGAEESYYIATRNNNYGVFNNKFDVIVPFEYTNIEKIIIGAMVYLKADKAGMQGILFGNGSPYLALENSKIAYIKSSDGNNYFIFTKDGKTGLKDTKYKNIAEAVYTDIMYDSVGPGFILTGDQDMKGFVFLNNKILEPKYAEVKPLKGGQYVKVKTPEGKWGYVNNSLVEFFEN
jgi:WG containing repeat